MDSPFDALAHADAAASDAPQPRVTRRAALLAGAVAGSVAALLAAAVSLWAGQRFGGVITAQLLADRITGVTPVSVFGRVLQQLEENAKPLTLIGLTLAQALAGAAIGAVYGLAWRRSAFRPRAGALLLGLAAWLILALAVAPLGQIGALARDAPGGATATLLLSAASAALFGLVTALAVPLLAGSREPAPVDLSRRRFAGGLGLAALVVPALLAGGYTMRYALRLRRTSSASPAPIADTVADADDDGAEAAGDAGPFGFAGMPRFITPTDEFYVVSKNIVDPEVDGSSWTLEIDGLVRQRVILSLTDLLARESVEFTSTLECISNPIGGGYISNAVWRGIPLVTLLDEAGLLDGIVDLELHAADGYVESIPLAEGLAPDTMLVHTMNGEPLNDKHGFPARLIVPGIFGMKNVKWLTKIIAVDEDILGFWQQRGWSDPAPVLTMSRLDVPGSQGRVIVGEPFVAGGVSFAGDKGISRVEVSFDGGDTWSDAELSDVPNDLTWRLWRIEHTPVDEASFDMHVRATDGRGELQTDERTPALPDGATGHHTIRVRVEGRDAASPPVPNTPIPAFREGVSGDGG
ncbi:MAG TPA: molybdopterin-dependent oxidoreductase [Thermomicrobiales bacterium]|nr:molybdopterin-dependent oxidoreductase [Thermomicrobiales bacterium]